MKKPKALFVFCVALNASASLYAQQTAPKITDTFFGIHDSRYPPDAQNQRRRDMRDNLINVVTDAFRGGQLDPKDPTAGMGGTAQHLTAALNAYSDLGTLIRHQGPPNDLALNNNYYAKLTQPYEKQLEQQILSSAGHLTPADVMRMSLSVTNGNYTLATMTAHNFLKNVTYTGRDLAASGNFLPKDKDALNLANVVSKLENLRGDPTAADKMGPWYHGFGVLFVASLIGGPGGTTLTDAEHFTRLFGLGGSRIDKEKMAWDDEMILAVRRIHDLIFQENRPTAGQLDPKKLQECQILLAQARQIMASGDLKAAQAALANVEKQCSGLTPNTGGGIDDLKRELERGVESMLDRVKTDRDNCKYKEALQRAEEAERLLPTLAWFSTNMQLLRRQATAQEAAQTELRPGLDAVRRKDLDGAIAAIHRAQQIPNAQDIPPCLRQQMDKLLAELESHKDFLKKTEQVEEATRKCDYKEADRVLGEITHITPREQYVTDWINVNVPKLAELQNKERAALDLIRKADAVAAKADTDSSTDPVDWNSVAATIKQGMDLLNQADQEAPKCLPQRQQMEQIRQKLNSLTTRKRAEIANSIVLLIDTSGSMGDNNKINQAKDAAKRAARQVSKTTEIAVLNFDGGCSPGSMRVAAGFTTDLNTLIAAIDGLQPGGGTPMYIATAAAVEYAQRQGRGKGRTVILMSDGGDSCRDQQAQSAAAIRSSNIPVSTIGFDVGNNAQAQGDLSNLSGMTGGRTFSASAADPREIIRAFNLAMLPSLLKDFDLGNVGGNAAGMMSQAKTMVQQYDIGGALMMLQQANNLAPNSANVNFNLSLLYEANDQLIPAVNHANNYLRLAPYAADRGDVENRVRDIQQELQKNPRVIMDSSGCKDILIWSQTERDAARKAGNAARVQAVLEIQISAQRGDCDRARSLSTDYKKRFP